MREADFRLNVLIVLVAAGDSDFIKDQTRNFGPVNCSTSF